MSAVIVTPDLVGPIKNGGIGTFAMHFARLLRERGYAVTILYTSPTMHPRETWLPAYAELGIEVIDLKLQRVTGKSELLRASEVVAASLPDTADVVYFQDWHGNGFHTVRQHRYSRGRRPLTVTILHSPMEWSREGMQRFAEGSYDEIATSVSERYAAEHSDVVVSPSRYMLDWTTARGWRLPPDCGALGLPYFPPTDNPPHPTPPEGTAYKRLVFFGRLETRKGLELFIDALHLLAKEQPAALASLEEIAFLGKEGEHRYGTMRAAIDALALPGTCATLLNTLGADEARAYLASVRDSALVVMPSLSDNFPYAVIEASLIPGLNFIASGVGGVPEIVGDGTHDRLFLPYARPLRTMLEMWLRRGYQPARAGEGYDWQAANARWIEFHQSMLERARARIFPTVVVDAPPAVDVCVPYFNHAAFLPQLLESLAQQTYANFRVFVVNDGSTDARANAVFEAMRDLYTPRGWQFVIKANGGLSDARNTAAALGSAPYLLFIDSDNVALPHMVERYANALHTSGDDCLTCYFSIFDGEGKPRESRRVLPFQRTPEVYAPLGNFAWAGMFINTFGDANFIIRREVFEAVGGFSTHDPAMRYVGNEDYELLVRLSLGNYKLDVLPEVLFHYRRLPDSLLRSTSPFQNVMRVQQVYRQHLETVGLGDLAPFVYGLFLSAQNLPTAIQTTHDPRWVAYHIPYRVLRDAVLYKVAKHLRRFPMLRGVLKRYW